MRGGYTYTVLSASETSRICDLQQMLTWEGIILVFLPILLWLAWLAIRTDQQINSNNPQYPSKPHRFHSWYLRRSWNKKNLFRKSWPWLVYYWRAATYWP